MGVILTKGRYRARLGVSAHDVSAAQRLRRVAFRGGAANDADDFDAVCDHVLIEDMNTADLVCCFRLMFLPNGADISQTYSAQFYDLSKLSKFGQPMIEMGRFCIHPDHHDPDIIRVAWGAMATHVDRREVAMLFGCSSFYGNDPIEYADVFALLRARHLAPERWMPGIKAADVFAFAANTVQRPNIRDAQAAMPPLLRTYLMMGGWVSDHAVIDRDLGTSHVFTGLEIGAVPPRRAQALRGIAT